ncbi:FAD:protein FMN transferase [Agaribacterium haliotis]|uniref:FAD:protein FMN transferase n=1 Tax=Agaribacterium haliotis TaxID=2013869 RepID=UPI001EFC506F|nr:FAD:protein FMN transferase [Agaribacterium haliotis]
MKRSAKAYCGLFVVSVLFYCAAVRAEWHSESQGIMGTEVSVTLWHKDSAVAKQAIAAVMQEMQRIDAQFSPYKKDSELAQLNRQAASKAQPISDELALLVEKSLAISELSGGAFDLTFATLAQYYDYRQAQKPSEAQIAELKKHINYRLLKFDASQPSLFYAHPKLKIDLGGIAKGHAVDRSVAILQKLGIKHASVSAGGDSRLLGDRRGRPWIVGIKHPRQRPEEREAVLKLPLENLAISTSGDYERFFIDEQSGERIHHIINPRTGKSAAQLMSVTIIGERGLDTDPLSTAVFILGVDKGLALINDLTGFDAIIIDANGKVHFSEGLMEAE